MCLDTAAEYFDLPKCVAVTSKQVRSGQDDKDPLPAANTLDRLQVSTISPPFSNAGSVDTDGRNNKPIDLRRMNMSGNDRQKERTFWSTRQAGQPRNYGIQLILF